jgi:hypothetical protein
MAAQAGWKIKAHRFGRDRGHRGTEAVRGRTRQ